MVAELYRQTVGLHYACVSRFMSVDCARKSFATACLRGLWRKTPEFDLFSLDDRFSCRQGDKVSGWVTKKIRASDGLLLKENSDLSVTCLVTRFRSGRFQTIQQLDTANPRLCFL